jgi:FtsZ-binding cell division protein ZapB
MPKKYFCENLIDLNICGEEDPVNFSPGRYNRCRKCRNEDVKKYQQKLKDQSMRENIEERVEDLKDGKKIQLLIETIFLGKGLTDDGLTLPEELHSMKNRIKTVSDNLLGFIKELSDENKKLKLENQNIKENFEKIKKDNSKIKYFLEQKFNLFFEE